MLQLIREGNADVTSMLYAFVQQCFTSFAREMPVTTDAVCLCATMLHLHMREMPTNVDAVLVAMLHKCEMNAIGVRVHQYISSLRVDM
jgi:hypothetical protein